MKTAPALETHNAGGSITTDDGSSVSPGLYEAIKAQSFLKISWEGSAF